MTGHTPGPWTVHDDVGRSLSIWGERSTNGGHVLAEVRLVGERSWEEEEEDPDTFSHFPEARANAQLMAAAPEMLFALRGALIGLRRDAHSTAAVVRAAIAKAAPPAS